MENKNLEEEIRSQLIKAVEDNADKFQNNYEEKRFEFNNELFVFYLKTGSKRTTIEYKNLNTSIKICDGDFTEYLEAFKNNDYSRVKNPYYKVLYFEAKRIEEERLRQAEELKRQQEQDLKELKKLCKNS